MPHFPQISFLLTEATKWFYEIDHLFFPVIVSLTEGGLVKKILETKKDYELSPSSPKSKEQVCTVVVAEVVSTRGQYQPCSLQ